MPEQNSPDVEESDNQHQPRRETNGVITQRLALLAIFVLAVLAVLAFAYVL